MLNNRESLIILFDKIAEGEEPGFAEYKVVNQAIGFNNFLKDFKNLFLLHLFEKIFERTDILYAILQKKSLDIGSSIRAVNETIKYLTDLRQQGFDSLWATVSAYEDIEERPRRGRPPNNNLSQEEVHKDLMNKILTVVISKVQSRYSNFETILFVELLCKEKFACYNVHTGNFPDRALDSLKSNYGPLFAYEKLKSELKVVYTDSTFAGYTVAELYQKLSHDASLGETFKETKKLSALILCMPSTSASAERVFSAMRRVKTYLRSTMSENRFSNLMLLAVEKDLLVKMQSNQSSFYPSVIEHFAKKGRRIELLYK
jgi:hypothetical protein